jgi:hypothetical protein
VAEPPKLSGPHAPILVSKTSDCYAGAPDNLTGSVRLPQGHRITTKIARLSNTNHTHQYCFAAEILLADFTSYKIFTLYLSE